MEIFLIKAAQLLLALALLVLVHEFGHYFFARIFGIRVEKFYLFFNPYFSILRYNPARGRIEFGTWTDKQERERSLACWQIGRDREADGKPVAEWRRTIYGIGWVPLGGYCKIAGMIDESMDREQMAKDPEPWEFRTRPAWQRLLVMVGGVVFNFLMAVAIYIGLVYSYGDKGIRFRDAYAGLDFVPAAIDAGFRPGDIPLMADGQEIETTDPDAALKMAQAKVVSVLRGGKDTVDVAIPEQFMFDINDQKGFFAFRLPVVVSAVVKGQPAAEAGLEPGDRITAVGDSLTPSYSELTSALKAYAEKPVELTVVRDGNEVRLSATPSADGTLGFNLTQLTDIYPVYSVEYSFLESFPKGWDLGMTTLSNYAGSMKHVFSKRGVQSLGGFGTLGSLFPERWNWYSFWYLTAFLSVALAVMNILPIPALDGGHVLILLYEMVTRRKLSEKFMEYVQFAGMMFLLLLMLYVNFNDVFRLL